MSASAAIQNFADLSAAVVCCVWLVYAPFTADQAAGLARMLKALADPARLRLVSLVVAHEVGEALRL